MTILTIYRALRTIALNEFGVLVVSAQIVSSPTGDPLKLRLDIVDGSLLDVFISVSGRYSYHWERRLTSVGDLHRHDNAPHHRWRNVATFPKHFHEGNESNVVESHISDDPESAIREFLTFARHKLLSTSSKD
jgi:hypothetical protein